MMRLDEIGKVRLSVKCNKNTGKLGGHGTFDYFIFYSFSGGRDRRGEKVFM